MKKLFFLGALFAVGLGFTACSSDKDEVENAQSSGDNSGENYIALTINLPQDPAANSRAGANDNNTNVTLDDGLADEYTVNNATLIIFNSAATSFKAAYSLSNAFSTVASSHHVTEASSTKCIQHVSSSIVAGDKALVILNNNGLIGITGTDLYLYDHDAGALSTTKFTGSFSDLATALTIAKTAGLDCGKMDDNGYFMANAVLVNKQGSTTVEPTDAATKVLVTISNVYKTEAEAEAAAADQIYVERGMAKVTLQGAPGTFGTTQSGGAALSYTIDGWTLDNTNPVSYLIRSDANWNNYRYLKSQQASNVYRCIGNTMVTYPTTPDHMFRSYFSESANFNHGTVLNRIALTPTWGDLYTAATSRSTQNPQYCFENTFSVANQTVNNTTLVQIKVHAGDGSTDYYTVNGNKTAIYTEDGLKGLVKSAAWNYLLSNSQINTAAAAAASVTLGTSDLTITGSGSGTSYTVTKIEATTNATYYLTSSITDASTISTIMGELGTIVRYENGVCYYSLRIKHFGDALTPWGDWEAAAGKTAPVNYTSTDATQADKIAKIYPDNSGNQANNYLGRYGVLRNNWYHLNISGIRYIGDPEPHTGAWDPIPDDEFENFISCQINVLSWAKRTQTANL